jgi:hypothetical protein
LKQFKVWAVDVLLKCRVQSSGSFLAPMDDHQGDLTWIMAKPFILALRREDSGVLGKDVAVLCLRIIRITIHPCNPTLPNMILLSTPARTLQLAFALAALCASTLAIAEPEATLVIKNHRFEPAEIKVPAGQRVRLTVHNQDSTPEEFESHQLNREKIVPPGAKVVIFIGPLKKGRYEFVGEYNEATAKGVVVAE